jgi:cobalt-zinc-cadmium efflux system protein
LQTVPRGIDIEAVQAWLEGQPGIAGVHDLHIWAMSTTGTALTAHLVKPDGQLDDRMLRDIAHEMEHRFSIHHVTLQWERGEERCRQACASEER